MRATLALLLLLAGNVLFSSAQENYFITYTNHLEEPGNLEFSAKNVFGNPKGANAFLGSATELEYGVNGWWTTELYLAGQSTANESTVFTGFRWENRFRPLMGEHWVNPLLYAEFENINGADKTLLEVVGHDGRKDFAERNSRAERKREMELKLILSSNVKGWNIAENIIAEKNLAGNPWEFGYALGASRPLALKASTQMCTWCRENMTLGAEMYGGLGDRYSFGLKDTSHYLAPVFTLQTPSGPRFHISPGFGLSSNSMGFLVRFKVSYEINQIFARLRGE
jgi:hypothetical protein